jgi:transmembrane sensor
MDRQGSSPSNGESADPPPRVTPQVAAEAALWVARLHGPSRSREMELQCLEWQSRSAAHRHAFERCTETWMEFPNAARAAGYEPSSSDRFASDGEKAGRGRRNRRGLLMLAGLALVAVGAGLSMRSGDDATAYRTAIGEAQTVVLSDGTRMSLNTDTRVRVDIGAKQRTVDIEGGEAAFDVAKDAARPFVVRVAGSEVVALGTVFSVRFVPRGSAAAESLSVTLVEGQVAVRSAARATGGIAPAAPLVMRAGERVRFVKDAADKSAARQDVDRPRMEQVLAWKRNEVVFDGASLAEAVVEMNRYSRTPVVLVGDLAQAGWQVSGQFRTGDNAAFANALAALHGLVVQENEGRLELSRKP